MYSHIREVVKFSFIYFILVINKIQERNTCMMPFSATFQFINVSLVLVIGSRTMTMTAHIHTHTASAGCNDFVILQLLPVL